MKKKSTMPLPKSGKIKFTRTVIYDIDELKDEFTRYLSGDTTDEDIANRIYDWLVEDMALPICSDTVIVTNGSGKKLNWKL